MLISVLIKSVINGIFIRELLIGIIYSKNMQFMLGFKVVKIVIELLNREMKEVFEEEWLDEFMLLRKGGFVDGFFLIRIKQFSQFNGY